MSRVVSEPMPWASFAASLTETLRRLPVDRTLVLSRDDDLDDDSDEGWGASLPRYVQFCRFDEALVRCEVVSNRFLPPEHCWIEEQEQSLLAMGWSAPDDARQASPNWYVDVQLAWVELGVELVVRVLRDLWAAHRLTDVVMSREDLRRFHWTDVAENPDADPDR